MSPPRKSKKKEPKAGVPIYIVTFSDMVTLLLTFFVLLLSMAEDQVDDNKFIIGMTSVQHSMTQFGLSGAMFSQGEGVEFDFPKPKYKVPDENNPDAMKDMDTKSIDYQTEMLQRVVMDIERLMKISPSQITGKDTTFTVTAIRFAAKSWKLKQSAIEELTDYCQRLRESFEGQNVTLYVVGIDSSVDSNADNWRLSARRAAAAKDFIRKNLSDQMKWPTYCWGAGTGGDWVGQEGLINKNTQIMIAAIVKKK